MRTGPSGGDGMTNLLTNAARYTDPGGRIDLIATHDREAGAIVIRVLDTGVGLAPEALSQIFELFAQASPARDRARVGLGIGLALVKSLVELHGGTVSADSPGPGRGCEFVVRLPAAGRAQADPGNRSPASPEAATPLDGTGEHQDSWDCRTDAARWRVAPIGFSGPPGPIPEKIGNLPLTGESDPSTFPLHIRPLLCSGPAVGEPSGISRQGFCAGIRNEGPRLVVRTPGHNRRSTRRQRSGHGRSCSCSPDRRGTARRRRSLGSRRAGPGGRARASA